MINTGLSLEERQAGSVFGEMNFYLASAKRFATASQFTTFQKAVM